MMRPSFYHEDRSSPAYYGLVENDTVSRRNPCPLPTFSGRLVCAGAAFSYPERLVFLHGQKAVTVFSMYVSGHMLRR